MANDPKKQQPNDDMPGEGADDDAALPPWLRGGDNAAKPQADPPADPPQPSGALPKLAPRKPAGDDDPSVPPWLRGLEAPKEKKVIIGGKEVSMDFFSEADSLAQDSNTDLTYDAWLADQNEARREKSIEEELPDFFNEIAAAAPTNDAPAAKPAAPSEYPMRDVTGGTSQLPDWFLGLEELDESDAPDWVRQIGADSRAPAEPPPPAPQPDSVTDFFQDFGVAVEDDSFSDLNLPPSSFFNELVGKPAASSTPPSSTPPSSSGPPSSTPPSSTPPSSSGPPSSRPPAATPPSSAEDDLPDFGILKGSAPGGGQTVRFDDDDPFAGFNQPDDAPAFPAQGGATMRFDPTPDLPTVGGETLRFDDDDPFAGFDQPDDAPAFPAQGGATMRFDPTPDLPTVGGETLRFDDDDPFADFDLAPAEQAAPPAAAADGLDDLFADFDSDQPSKEATLPTPPQAVAIPDFELDAFLEGIAPVTAPRDAEPDLSDIEDPDLDFSPTPAAPQAMSDPEPEAESAPLDADSLSWLNEIDSIVSRASGATAEPTPEESGWSADPSADIDALDFDGPAESPRAEISWDDWEQNAPATTTAMDQVEEPTTPVAPSTDQLDWLSGIGEGDAPSEAKTVQIDREMLARMGLLSQRGAVQADPPADEPPLAQAADDDSALDLENLYADDDAFSAAGLEPLDFEAERVDTDGIDLSGFDAGTLERLNQLRGVAPDESAVFDAELRTGWMHDDLLSEAALLDSALGLPSIESTPAVYPPATRDGGDPFADPDPLSDEDDPFAMLRDPASPAAPAIEELDEAFFDLMDDPPSESPPVRTTFEIPDDEDWTGQQSTIDFGLWEQQSAATAAPYTPPSGFYLDDAGNDQPDTLDVSMFDEPGDAPAMPVTDALPRTDMLSFIAPDDEDDQPDTLDLSMFDEPGDAPAMPVTDALPRTDMLSFIAPDDEDDQPDTLDLSMFDEPGDTPAMPVTDALPRTDMLSFIAPDDEDDQPDTLDLSMFDEPGDAPAMPVTDALPRTDMLSFIAPDDDDDQPDTLDLSMFDEPAEATPEPYTPPGVGSFFDDLSMQEDQPETLDLSMFDEPAEATPEPYTPPGVGSFFDDLSMQEDQPETLDLSMFDEPAEATPEPYTPPGVGSFFDDLPMQEDQPETLDLSMFDEPAEATPEPYTPPGVGSFFDDLPMQEDQPETLDLSMFDEPETPRQQSSDPHATQLVPDEWPMDDWSNLAPMSGAGEVEHAASEDFLDSFSLDDPSSLMAPPPTAADLFEVDDILAALDSNTISDDDTQPQEAIVVDSPPAPAPAGDLFASWDDEPVQQSGNLDDLDALFGMAPTNAAPAPVAFDDGLAFNDSTDAPLPGFGEGIDWSAAFDQDASNRPVIDSSGDIEAFLSGGPSVEAFTRDTEVVPPFNAAPPAAPVFEDLDTYLDSLDLEGPQVGQNTNMLFNRADRLDIDALLDQSVTSGDARKGKSPFEVPDAAGLESADLDFLRDMSASVGDVSAGAIVRQKEDRPVEELPERLRRLRERARQSEEGDTPAAQDSLSGILPGVDIALNPATFTTSGTSGAERALSLTADQQARVALLTGIVGTAPEPKRRTAIEATYDTPFMQDFEDDDENIVHPPTVEVPVAALPRVRRRRRIRLQADRLLIVVLLAAAVIAPVLVPGLRIGDPPAVSFAPGSLGSAAYSALDSLQRGDRVLVGLEYAPGASGELDPMTDALLRHIVLRGAVPVVIGTNPLTLLRAERYFEALNADPDLLARIDARQPLTVGYEYGVARFITGGVIGLRAFSADSAALLGADIAGQTADLGVTGLESFALLLLITDSGETGRDYAEQIAVYSRAPLIAAVSYAASVMLEPYARAGAIDGLLSGYGDALTYSGLLDSVDAVARGFRPTRTPAPPTTTPRATRQPDAVIVPGAEVTPDVTAESTVEATSEATPETGPLQLFAVVNAGDRINVRARPDRTGEIITSLPPGTRVEIVGSGGDNDTWANVVLADGRVGWVLASLLTIEPPARNKPIPLRQPHEQDFDVPATNTRPPTRAITRTATASPSPSAQPSATLEPSATAEPSATRPIPTATASPAATEEAAASGSDTPPPTVSEVSPSATPAPTDIPETPTPSGPTPTPTPLTFSDGLREERWYGMNLGIIVTVLIIGGGALANIVRSLTRRRR